MLRELCRSRRRKEGIERVEKIGARKCSFSSFARKARRGEVGKRERVCGGEAERRGRKRACKKEKRGKGCRVRKEGKRGKRGRNAESRERKDCKESRESSECAAGKISERRRTGAVGGEKLKQKHDTKRREWER
eukprot:3054345-Pleurochrysis_carterae.AAC.1